jgi:PDZ domain-containing secreted protein
MPKLMIKYFGNLSGEVSELEEARYLLDFDEAIIVIEGQNVRSYDELVKIVSQERFKDKEFVEVMQMTLVQGG